MSKKNEHFAIQVLRRELKSIEREIAKIEHLLFGDHYSELFRLRAEIVKKEHASLQEQSDYLASMAPKVSALEKKYRQSMNTKALFRREAVLEGRRRKLRYAIDQMTFYLREY